MCVVISTHFYKIIFTFDFICVAEGYNHASHKPLYYIRQLWKSFGYRFVACLYSSRYTCYHILCLGIPFLMRMTRMGTEKSFYMTFLYQITVYVCQLLGYTWFFHMTSNLVIMLQPCPSLYLCDISKYV